MKNSIFILSSLFFLFAAHNAFAVKDTRKPGSFSQLKVYGRFDVVLVKGNEETVTLESETTNLHDVLTEIEKGKLKIKMSGNYYKDIDVKVVVTYKQLNEIDGGAGAIIDAGTVESKKFFFDINSGAEVKGEVITDTLTTIVSQGAILTLSGKAIYYDAQVSTGGQVTAYLLNANAAKARVKMGGYAKLYVKEKLDAAVNMGGNISFKGQPKEVKQATNMGGSITEIRE